MGDPAEEGVPFELSSVTGRRGSGRSELCLIWEVTSSTVRLRMITSCDRNKCRTPKWANHVRPCQSVAEYPEKFTGSRARVTKLSMGASAG